MEIRGVSKIALRSALTTAGNFSFVINVIGHGDAIGGVLAKGIWACTKLAPSLNLVRHHKATLKMRFEEVLLSILGALHQNPMCVCR